jgi:hypothetical protein
MTEIQLLRDTRFRPYLPLPIPHPLDDIVESVVAAYRLASSADKRAMAAEIDSAPASVLRCYGERTATMAVRATSPEPLRWGLVALSMAQCGLRDYRTSLVALAAVNHSADTVGVPLSALLDDLADELPERALATFRSFTERNDRDKSLYAMHLKTTGAGETFRYVSA